MSRDGDARRRPGGGGCPARPGRDPAAIRRGVVTEPRPARADDFHSAPDLFRPTGRNLRTVRWRSSLVTPLIGIKRKSIDLVIDEN